ncbi:replication-relaxation family protein [Planctomycetota bacterium]
MLSLAEHRVLTTSHLSALQQRNTPALRRRMRVLASADLVWSSDAGLNERPGRPERIHSLTEKGAQLLQEKGVLSADVPPSQMTGRDIRCLGHLLFLNDVRVHLAMLGRVVPDLAVQFLSPGSLQPGAGSEAVPIIHERFHTQDGPDGLIEFTPDGVFTVSHAATGRALLFFLEADMGTEALVSVRHRRRDVRQKITNYQACFSLKRYKRYEGIFGGSFRGFRLLLAASSSERHGALCELVRRMPPCDFIWLTDRDSMQSEGIWSAIWVRGGCPDRQLESILGSQMPSPCPSPADVT